MTKTRILKVKPEYFVSDAEYRKYFSKLRRKTNRKVEGISVWVDAKVVAKLKKRCDDREMSMSQYVRELIVKDLR
jgi:hypothetical protein